MSTISRKPVFRSNRIVSSAVDPDGDVFSDSGSAVQIGGTLKVTFHLSYSDLLLIVGSVVHFKQYCCQC